MAVQIGGGTSALMRALQQEIAQKEAARDRRLGNIHGGVRGFANAQATGAIQDNLAALAAPPVEAPTMGPPGGAPPAPTAPSLPPKALGKLDTGGFLGRLYGGLMGPDAYMRKMQPAIGVAQQQDQEAQRRFYFEQQRADEMRRRQEAEATQLLKMRQEIAEREAMANAMGLGGVNPNVPASAYDSLLRIREQREARDREKNRNDTWAEALGRGKDGLSDLAESGEFGPDDYGKFLRQLQGLYPEPEPPEETMEERLARIEAESMARARGSAAGAPAEPEEPLEARLARIEAESAARARGSAAGSPAEPEETMEERLARIEAESAARARGSAAGSPPAERAYSPTFEEKSRLNVIEDRLSQAERTFNRLSSMGVDQQAEVALSGKTYAEALLDAKAEMHAQMMLVNAWYRQRGLAPPYPEIED